MIRRFSIGYDVELHKRTLERGLLSLLGPRADDGGGGRRSCRQPSTRTSPARSAGSPVRAIRTDLGIDLLCDAADTDALAAALRARRRRAGVRRRSPTACAIERGRPRYGVDLDDTVIPQEAGLNDRAVSFTKGCYVGQETVARLYYRGKPNRQLRGLRLSAPRRDRRRDHVRRADRRPAGQRRAVAGPGAARARARAPRGAAGLRGDRRRRRDRGGRRRAPVRALTRPPRKRPRSATAAVGRRAAAPAAACRDARPASVPRIRTSSISSGGTCAPSSPIRPLRATRGRGARLELVEVAPPSGPQSTSRPPAIQKPSKSSLGRVRGEHQARPGVGGLEHAAEAPEDHAAGGAGADAARPRARSAARAAAARIWRSTWSSSAPAGRVGGRSRPRTAAAPRRAGGGRGWGPGRPGTATGSGPSARRRRGARAAAGGGRSGADRTASRAARPAPAPAAGRAAARS